MKQEITNIDGKFYDKCKVVMLPTEKASFLTRNTYKTKPHHGNPLDYTKIVLGNAVERGFEYQHLYFLSDEEIKEGDWIFNKEYYDSSSKFFIYQAKTVADIENYKSGLGGSIWFKIIATTDESLSIYVGDSFDGRTGIYTSLPRPSDAFIKKYVELQGKIDEVLIEVKFNELFPITHTNHIVKIAPDNTITIKPVVEKMYTRQEVINIAAKAWYEGKYRTYQKRLGEEYLSFSEWQTTTEYYNWINSKI